MANILLSWQNRADQASVSGGSWLTNLPLSNLLNRQVQKVARSSSATNSATRFGAALNSAQSIDVVALVVHNMDENARVRVRCWGGTGAPPAQVLLNQDDLSAAAWTRVNVATSAATITTPANTNSAQQMQASANGAAYVRQTITTTVNGQTVSLLLYLQRNPSVAIPATSFNQVRVFNATSSTLLYQCRVNWDTAQVYDVTSSFVSNASRAAIDNGWLRIELQAGTLSNSGSSIDIEFGEVTGTATAGQAVRVWMPEAFRLVMPLHTSSMVKVWPDGVIPQQLLEWEEDNFWFGTLSAAARAGYQTPFIYRLPATQLAGSWYTEIFNTQNSDNYVQIGRLFLGKSWSPSVNYTYGAGLVYEDPTIIERSLSGAEYFDIRSRFRVFDFDLQYIVASEAYGAVLELQRLAGTSGEVLVIADPDDAANMPKRAFVGRLLSIGSVVQEKPDAFTVNLKIKELI